MDSREGIEKVVPVDTQAVGLLDPSFLRPGTPVPLRLICPGSGRVVQLGRVPSQMNTLDGNQIACTSGY